MPDEKLDIPRLARHCWERFQAATTEQREAEKESAGFYIGGRFQWRKGEIETREGKQRPWISIPRLKSVVDQVENEARQNPPGPQAHPVGGGADKDGADILEGMIREYEYRSDAQHSYITGLRSACARMRGAFEMGTQFVDEKSFESQLVIKELPNIECLFVDPDAVMPCREDAMWQGKIMLLTRDQLIEQHGKDLKVLNRDLIDRFTGWMSDVVSARRDNATINAWTGAGNKDGPFYICEFWRVEITKDTLTLYDDHTTYFKDDMVPSGVAPLLDEDGKPKSQRVVGRRKVMKYLVTALDEISKTEWYGDIIPIFWIMGPEMWLEGECHRQSLISPAIDAQRGLNYTATTAAEIVGGMNKSPFIGYVGQFDVTNAQGINPWDNFNGNMWPYMEVNPVYATDPINGQNQLLPPPQRNTWEAPIDRVLQLGQFFIEAIKAATSVFFEPSMPSARAAQSGRAIQALQQQTNIGTLNWQDNMHRAVGVSYRQAAMVMRRIYSETRVRTIVKPDNSHEIETINNEFPAIGADGKPGKKNMITLGQYSLRVTAGPNFQTRQEEAIDNLVNVFKIVPQLLGAPGIAAQFLRMMGEGNPQIEQMADALSPEGQDSDNPQAMQANLAKAMGENQQLKGMLQQMQQQIEAKLPQIEAQKWVAMLKAATDLEKARITASKDTDLAGSQQTAEFLLGSLGMAHDAGMQATQHAHEASQQQSQQQAASMAQVSDQAAAQQQADQANQDEE